MANNNTHTANNNGATAARRTTTTETKSSLKTTEFYVFVLVSIAILVASAMVDNGDDGQGFGADHAWMYVAFLSVGYMISRGLAKAGSHAHDRDDH